MDPPILPCYHAVGIYVLITGISPAPMKFLQLLKDLKHPPKELLSWQAGAVFQTGCQQIAWHAVRTDITPPLVFHKFQNVVFCLLYNIHPTGLNYNPAFKRN